MIQLSVMVLYKADISIIPSQGRIQDFKLGGGGAPKKNYAERR
jgi:hypothetical protein